MITHQFEILSIFDENKELVIKVNTCDDQFHLSPQENNEDEKCCDESHMGRWSYDEQLLYLEFSKNNTRALENKENRRSSKVFKQMAKIVITRSADQCRSHHQKMEKKHGSVQNILTQCQRGLEKLRNRSRRGAKKNIVPAVSLLDIKACLENAMFEAKTPLTPMTAGPEESEIIELNDFDDFLNHDQPLELRLGVEEQQSFYLDFCNYSYDPLF